MKKPYENPKIELYELMSEDIIVTSSTTESEWEDDNTNDDGWI